MASTSNNCIQRFTYDWMIRFAELHRTYDQMFLNVYKYRLYNSNYRYISPLFTTLINNHMPHLLEPRVFEVNEDQFKGIELPDDKKPIVINSIGVFNYVKSGTITNLQSKRIVFHLGGVYAENSSFTSDEFKALLVCCDTLYSNNCALTEPTNFSDIWPVMEKNSYMDLIFDIKNLVYDKDMVQTMLQHHRQRHHCHETNDTSPRKIINEVWFKNFPFSENVIMDMLEYFLTCVRFPDSIHWEFEPKYGTMDLQPTIDKIHAKMLGAGYVFAEDETEINIHGHDRVDDTIKEIMVRCDKGLYHVF